MKRLYVNDSMFYGIEYRRKTGCVKNCKTHDCSNCEKLKKYIEEQESAEHKKQ